MESYTYTLADKRADLRRLMSVAKRLHKLTRSPVYEEFRVHVKEFLATDFTLDDCKEFSRNTSVPGWVPSRAREFQPRVSSNVEALQEQAEELVRGLRAVGTRSD